ncbi:MAG: hypothetical protein R6U88_00975 [Candidatus Bipolaricaulota bacterium]
MKLWSGRKKDNSIEIIGTTLLPQIRRTGQGQGVGKVRMMEVTTSTQATA